MKIDFSALADELLRDAPNLLRQWLPNGKLRNREFVIGNLRGDNGDSLNINIDTGKWHDMATGEKGGDIISLYSAIHGIKQSEAAKKLSNGHEIIEEDTYITGQECYPLPPHKHGKPSKTWEYKDAQGKTLFYICRFDPLNEGKQFAPLTCWRKASGNIVWKWKKSPDPQPIYQLDKIAQNPSAKILIVEGEKAADAAQLLLPADWIATTWPGGASTVKKSDWKILKDRSIWIWPDRDEPGIKAANQIKIILPSAHIVPVETMDLEKGWDLADAPAGYNILHNLQNEKRTISLVTDKKDRKLLLFPHRNDKNKSLATLDNMRELLAYHRVICRYNVISKRILHIVPNEEFSTENEEEAALACIYSYMKEAELPVDGYKLYLTRIADENQYNPVLQWIKSKPWDGISRLQDFYNTIESTENEAKELLIRRWLITAVCMAKGDGVDSAGCLVLQGGQDMGKTWWVKKLVPDEVRKEFLRTDAMVDPRDKDSVSQVISYWIVELGEIGATFRKADIDALKAFITRDNDIMRRPYGEGDKRYPRRTALIASVDQTIYLSDTAGNRRFWTIPCTSINSYHEIDMQQLWAEVLVLVNNGEDWRLQPDEKEHIRRINENHMQIEPIHELIEQRYFKEDGERLIREWKTATEIAREIELKNVSQRETRIITAYLRARKCYSKKIAGSTLFSI